MRFTGLVIKTGLDYSTEVMEIMLYNGRKILVRGPCFVESRNITPGDLIEFCCGRKDSDNVDLECDQTPNTYYIVNKDFVTQVKDEDTIRTFLMSAKILGEKPASPRNKSSCRTTRLYSISCRPLRKVA